MRPGSLLVGQAGGPTSAINASLVGVVHEAQALHSGPIVGVRHGITGLLAGDCVDLGRQPAAVLDAVRSTPSAALGATRHRLADAELDAIIAALRKLAVRHLLYIGGNDSADTMHRIAAYSAQVGYELCCVSIPKTIDNDLEETDHTPGYGSAARYLALATRDAGRDTEAMRHTDPVKLLEAPGRNAGWLAAASALAREQPGDAPHLILPPEVPVDLAHFLGAVSDAYDRHGCVVAVVAETARDASGAPIGADDRAMGPADAFGHRRLSGAAAYLCEQIAGRLRLRARWEKPGTLIRTSRTCASAVDLDEAYQAGRAAVRAALAGSTDRMVTLIREPGATYRCQLGLAELARIANRERVLPAAFFAGARYDVTDAFLAYARPLLGEPLVPYGRLADLRPE